MTSSTVEPAVSRLARPKRDGKRPATLPRRTAQAGTTKTATKISSPGRGRMELNAGEAGPCRTCRKTWACRCKPAQAHPRRRRWPRRTRRTSWPASLNRSSDISFPSNRSSGPEFRCPARTSHNEIRKSAWRKRNGCFEILKGEAVIEVRIAASFTLSLGHRPGEVCAGEKRQTPAPSSAVPGRAQALGLRQSPAALGLPGWGVAGRPAFTPIRRIQSTAATTIYWQRSR